MEKFEKQESSPEATCTSSIKKESNSAEVMTLLTVEDILKTYSQDEQDSYAQYQQFLKLKTENPMFGYKKLAKMIGVSISKTRWWKQKGEKVTTLEVIEKLVFAGLLPLTTENSKLPAILRLLAAGFTDGGIDSRMNTFHFNSARMDNIEAWKKDFLEVFPWGEDGLSAIITGEKESSIGVRTCDRAIIRFFAALGCPVGNKTIVSYKLPEFLFNLSENLKAAFLDGFFSCEASVPPVTTFSISLSKIEEKENEHLEFLKKFCQLCESVGIQHTSIARVPQKAEINNKSRRKDGKICDSYRILFSYTSENVLRVHELIPMTYAAEKKERFDSALGRFLKKQSKTQKPLSLWKIATKK